MHTPNKRKSQQRALTTTSYAVLSVLALRPHSTYDLTRQMQLSIRYLWPRAESNVYAEPPRLVEAGLASARDDWIGQRRRTIYSITEPGKRALADWLGSTSSSQRYECEALLKVLFAENGTRDDLLASIQAIGDDATEVIRHFLEIADRYAGDDGAYPYRFALTGLAARLLMEQQAATVRWAAWARAIVEGWETPVSGSTDWGIQVLHSTGEPLPLSEDPVDEIVTREPATPSPRKDRRPPP